MDIHPPNRAHDALDYAGTDPRELPRILSAYKTLLQNALETLEDPSLNGQTGRFRRTVDDARMHIGKIQAILNENNRRIR